MRKVIFLLVSVSLLFLGGYSQINVVHINNNTTPSGKDGFFYTLPRTVIRIDVEVDRVENYKGPYAEYALKYLGLKNVVESTSVEYRITDIRITTAPQPDPDQYYFVEVGEKLTKGEKSGMLAFTKCGLMMGLTREMIEDPLREQSPASDNKATITEKDVFPEIFKYSADVSIFEKIDTIIRKVNIDTMTIERQVLKRTMVEKPMEQKAKEAADFISKIRDNRFNLISGYQEVNYNKETLEYMDEQLKLIQKEYMKLFTGISLHNSLTFSFSYTPNPNQVNTEVPVFKFHKNKGILGIDESGGKPVTIKIQRTGNTGIVSGYLKKSESSRKPCGFFYRIPESATILVKVDENFQKESQQMVNQLGVVSYLPTNKWKVNLYPETGGIRSIEVE